MDRYASRQPKTRNEESVRRPGLKCLAPCLALACLSAVGCVDRTIKINSEPAGALVYLNDQEVGRAPIKVNFTWYGDYDIILRKKGYKTVLTHKRIDAPWYQWPGIDLVTECLIPTTIHDDRDFGTFEMEKLQNPSKEELIQRAEEMRSMAIGSEMPADAPVEAE